MVAVPVIIHCQIHPSDNCSHKTKGIEGSVGAFASDKLLVRMGLVTALSKLIGKWRGICEGLGWLERWQALTVR